MPANQTGGYTNDDNDQARQARRQGAQPNTGYVNFDAYFNGNRDAAQRGAQQLENQATGAVNAFRSDLGQTQGQFAQDTAKNAPQDPNAAPQGSTNVGSGSQMRNDQMQRAPTSQTQPQNAPQTEAGYRQQLANQAGSTMYGGPSGLSVESSYQNTANAAQAAQDELNSLNNTGQTGVDASGNPTGNLATLVRGQNPRESQGAGFLSSALEGAAGSNDFEALRRQFNPQQELANAEKASEGTAAQEQALQQQYAEAAQKQLADLNKPQQAAPSQPQQVPADQYTNPPNVDSQIDADVAAGMSPDQIVSKYGYAAYDNYVSEQFKRQ